MFDLRAGLPTALLVLILTGCAARTVNAGPVAGPPQDDGPTMQRQRELVHFVRNDCGACHGIHLTGGLGMAITPQALTGQTPETISATILYGHPGTPMPGWRGLLSEADARWIAKHLLAGFPEEP
jgi:cytochrome c55X